MPNSNRFHLRLLAAAPLAAALVLAVVLVNARGGAAAPRTGPAVSTASTSLGRILVSSTGRTLYVFSKDRNGRSSCSGMCAQFWPPLLAAGKPRALAGVRASLLGTTKRTDGRLQVTYNRHPLYRFVQDVRKGQTAGEGKVAFGGTWHAVSPAGTAVLPRPKPPVQSGIPQNNGGDHDSDNNGGPSDGDGNI